MAHVVISGASIAGLSAAFWLQRTGWQVTVLERADGFRTGGQNIDVRGVAHQVLDRMDLTDAVKAHNTSETGTVLVDSNGGVITELPSEGSDGATAELEILRGDFAEVIRDALPNTVDFVFGDAIETVEEHADTVTARMHSGRALDADLLVIAEGVRSATRDQLFADEVQRHPLGVTMAFGTITREPDDDTMWRWYNASGGRQVHLRPDNHGTTRAILAYDDSDDDEDLATLGRDEALARLRQRFSDAGWQATRILDGFEHTDDLYIDRLMRIDMPTWHSDRVCVVGDAAWCVTPLGGGGASLALTSGYVLTAFLRAHPADLPAALTGYGQWMRPVVDSVQQFRPVMRHFAFPQSELGLTAQRWFTRAMSAKPVAPLTEKLMSISDTDRQLPTIEDGQARR